MNKVKTWHIGPNSGKCCICRFCGEEKLHHAKGSCYACYRKHLWRPKAVRCSNCGRMRPHKAFGLCGGCHSRLHHYESVKEYNSRRYYGLSLEEYSSYTRKCVICGFDKVVDLHHLDGNKVNSESRNLVGLCPNHHRMIHSFDYFEEVKVILEGLGYDVAKVSPANFIREP